MALLRKEAVIQGADSVEVWACNQGCYDGVYLDQAGAEAGFDGRAYDFGSALHEALTDGMCAVRWMQRQPAFSDSCHEAGQPDEAEDAGMIRAEGYFQ